MPIPKKSLGQNFLMHPQTAERIVHAALLSPQSAVLEIGPGTGMLTRVLLKEGHRVAAVEADGELVTELKQTFAAEIESCALTLVHADIRAFDPSVLPPDYALVANIPYYVTGEIIRMFLTTPHKPGSMTLLVQKEVAERIARSGKKESILSLSVKAYGTPNYCFTVPRGAFRPAPNVDSAVISIQDIRRDAFGSAREEALFFDLVRAGFAHKRKFLLGNLAHFGAPERLRQAFEKAGIAEKARAEDISLVQWQALVQEVI